MIKNTVCFLCFILMSVTITAQNNALLGFENLVNKTWFADGEWSNGTKFKQEVSYTFDLNRTIVITNSKGFVNQEQTKFGNRNHGIRQYNSKTKTIEFWEFDVFGDLTKGTVELKDKNIFYHYKYGESNVTDCWEYINDNIYKFTVGNYVDGEWKAVYLQTEFKLKEE